MSEDSHEDKMLEEAIERLIEHFDSVAILVTLKEGTSARTLNKFRGNYYATMGIMREVVLIDEERARMNARAESPED